MSSVDSSALQHRARVGPSRLAGKGVLANEDIDEGEHIARIERPLLAVLDTKNLPLCCEDCLRTEPGKPPVSILRYCVGCRSVKFCSKRCQTRSWKRSHRYECRLYKDAAPNLPGSVVRATAQLLILKRHGLITPAMSAELDRLRSSTVPMHPDDLDSVEITQKFLRGDPKCSGTIWVEIVHIMGLLKINCFTLVHEWSDPLGVALDPFISTVNHSCRPNAVVVFNGASPSLRSIRPIAKDEEVTWSYVDVVDPRHRRRARLRRGYEFDCTCPKCTSNDVDDAKPESELEQRLWKAMAFANKEQDSVKAKSLLKAIIRTAQENKYPTTRAPIPEAYQALLVECNATEEWRSSFIIAIKQYFFIDPKLYPQEFYITRVVHTWSLVNVMQVFGNRYMEANDAGGWEREWGIDDIAAPLHRILKALRVNVVKCYGPGQVVDLINEAAERFDTSLEVLPAYARNFVTKDLSDIWSQLERLRHNKVDMSDAAPELVLGPS
ncbi:hypothetical protein CAC42_7683 [Sphaceloma murrayae]|uniref:Uncharacterized protein n=1 Tax=Sphaceloma murrayae TaxID=2082308 RepID=A0A2K1QXD3_9PEZI|nr:hypothetical protein CAC42_7683 [Sphaceloma murrayae]